MSISSALVCTLATIGCGEGSTSEGSASSNNSGTDGNSGSGDTEGVDGTTDNGAEPEGNAPEVLTLVASRFTLEQGEELLVAAVASDIDGADDVQSGRLHLVDGTTVSDFLPLAPGEWQTVVTWAELDALDAINNNALILRGTFSDAAGNEGSKDVEVTVCSADFESCVDNDFSTGFFCADIQNDDENCGSCGRDCDDEYDYYSYMCVDGNCEIVGAAPDSELDLDANVVLHGANVSLESSADEVTATPPEVRLSSHSSELSDETRESFNLRRPNPPSQ